MKSQLVTSIMCGLDAIAKGMGVGPNRVREWISQGAPIYQDLLNGKYYAHAGELWEWYKKRLVKGGYSAKSKSGDD